MHHFIPGLFVCLCLLEPVAAEPFRIAILHADDLKHADEFDVVVKRLGWESVKFPNSQADAVAGRLGEFDMVAGAPLFFGDGKAYLPEAAAWRAFVEKGGALVITDANYPQAVEWLEAVDPAFKSYGNGRDNRRNPTTPPALSDPVHPLYFLPNAKLPNEDVTSWGDLELDEKLGWEVALSAGNGKPSAALNRLGKGFCYLSNQRQGNVATFENLRSNLELQRLGLRATRFSLPGSFIAEGERPSLKNGSGEASIFLVFSNKKPASIALELAVTPVSGKPEKFTAKAVAATETKLVLPYRIATRGEARVTLRVVTPEGRATVLDRRVDFPPLLALKPPAYRGMIEEATGSTRFAAIISPAGESLAGAKLRVRVVDCSGRPVADAVEIAPRGLAFDLPLATGKLEPGDYRAEAELKTPDGTTLGKAEAAFQVVAKKPTRVVNGEDLVTRVGGEPFFPLGIYHVADADLPLIRELGFNSIQGWDWGEEHARNMLNASEKAGLRVLFETGNIRRRTGELPAIIGRFKDHPALLAWYVFDEPQEPDHDLCASIRDTFRKHDPDHPTFMLSFLPHLFAPQAALGDIFAVDPYPLPNPSLAQVTDWTRRAIAAAGARPVWVVNESFGRATEAQTRCMAWLSIVHGARGLFWYPWDDGGTTGLKHHADQHAGFKRVLGEIVELTPALTGAHRKTLVSDDGKMTALLCADGKTRYLIAANSEASATKARFDVPGLSSGTALKAADSGVRVSGGKVDLEFPPHGVKIFRW